MRGNLKALGLALLAAFAMSAVAASAAHGTTAKFTAAEYPAVATGAQEGQPTNSDNYFEATPNRKTECHVATYEATLAAASTELTVTPHYTQCSSSILDVTVDLNGCHFTFKTGAIHSTTEVTGTATVNCAEGKEITITAGGAPTCIIHIPGDNTVPGSPKNVNLTGVTFTNIANGDVTVDVDITNQIHYTDTDTQPILCPFMGESTNANGSFRSTVLVEGFKETKHGTNSTGNTSYEHGAAVNIDVKTG